MKRLHAIVVGALGLLASVPAFAKDTVYYVHTDPLGSVVMVTDANRNVVERTEYAPYGQVLNRPEHDGPGYTGHEEDAATGLTNMQARYDDKVIGRMLSTDPMDVDPGTGANFNRYAYANDNPYRFTDPDGRQSAEDYQNLQQVQQSMPDVPMTLVSMDGHWQPVPTSVAADVMLSRDSGTSTAQYNHMPTRQETASAMDKTSVAATGVAVVTAETPVGAVAGVVDEAAAVAAFVFDPTMERAANVLTVGALGAMKAAAKGSEEAEKTVGALEKANQASTLVKASMPSPQVTQKLPPPPPPPKEQED